MRRQQVRFGILIIILTSISIACSSSKELASEEPIPVRYKGWHLDWTDSLQYVGVDARRAYESFLVGKEPKKKVIVAVIDSGVDRFHEDLKDVVWKNEDEIEGNGIDDDENGYIDDIYGWNFIGGPDSTHVEDDSFELTRVYWDLNKKFEGKDRSEVEEDQVRQWDYYQEIKEEVKKEKKNLLEELKLIQQVSVAAEYAMDTFGLTTLEGSEKIIAIPTSTLDYFEREAKEIITLLHEDDITEATIEEELDRIQNYLKGFDKEQDTREEIVGDNYHDFSNRIYGNNDVVGPDPFHGTHVAGIIGAMHNGVGIRGVSDQVQLMIIRIVPNGDERDKDVANAIRYAVDNGADIINMSFGKPYSPHRLYVEEAIKYADSKEVLMIHAAGNDGMNIDEEDNFPKKKFADGSGQANHWITVGASSWEEQDFLAAEFSNYGYNSVDVFAPGVDIYSTVPSDKYKYNDGTSMAAPVVSGIAAMIMAYYPDLSALQVKEAILESVLLLDDMEVLKPGTDDEEYVLFGDLSVTGGIVNLYDAMVKAQEMSFE